MAKQINKMLLCNVISGWIIFKLVTILKKIKEKKKGQLLLITFFYIHINVIITHSQSKISAPVKTVWNQDDNCFFSRTGQKIIQQPPQQHLPVLHHLSYPL